jgi:hypothetical protein
MRKYTSFQSADKFFGERTTQALRRRIEPPLNELGQLA